MFETLAGPLMDTRLEPDVADLLWSLTDLFHRKAARVQRQLDGNEDRQRRSQAEQDGSEIRSVELERLIAQGQTLIERRNAFEMLRDRAAEHYESAHRLRLAPARGLHGQPQAPDRRHDRQPRLHRRQAPRRDRGASSRRPEDRLRRRHDCNDHHAIWAALDKVHAKHPDMVLLHGGTPTGAERIAACWADKRKVTQIAFKPDWTREGKAAPFKRNDRMLEVLPIGLVVFPGSGITGQPRRQGEEARHPADGLPQARRVGAAFCSGGRPPRRSFSSPKIPRRRQPKRDCTLNRHPHSGRRRRRERRRRAKAGENG